MRKIVSIYSIQTQHPIEMPTINSLKQIADLQLVKKNKSVIPVMAKLTGFLVENTTEFVIKLSDQITVDAACLSGI